MSANLEPLEARTVPAGVTITDTTTVFDGFFDTKSRADMFGAAVASGDFNGDGILDIAVGAPVSLDTPAAVYVFFGKAGGQLQMPAPDALDGSNGFRIVSGALQDSLGASLANAGDVNGDGIDDLVIGAAAANGGQGAAYVLFGSRGAHAATLDLTSLNGTNGFRIEGEANSHSTGLSVAGGDFNGDGISDIVLNSQVTTGESGSSSRAYILFGHTGAFSASESLGNLGSGKGVKFLNLPGVLGIPAVGAGGDINGDGIEDVVFTTNSPYQHDVGYPNFTAAVVLYGRQSWTAVVDNPQLNGQNGFVISTKDLAPMTWSSVRTAGDFNNDGYDDLIVGLNHSAPSYEQAGSVHVIYGSADGYGGSIDPLSLDGSNGFTLRPPGGAFLPYSASSAGDFNRDGIGDIIVEAAVLNDSGNAYTSTIYVVYGQTGLNDPVLIAGTTGGLIMPLNGKMVSMDTNNGIPSLGDLNKDGYDDLVLIDWKQSWNSQVGSEEYYHSGRLAFLFGRDSGEPDLEISDDGKTATYTEADGDIVTLKTNRGDFHDAKFSFGTGGYGYKLLELELDSESWGSKKGLRLDVSAERAPSGDGFADIGFIDAAGIDLRKVTVDGTLGGIFAGDDNLKTAAIGLLQTRILGDASPEWGALESRFVGEIKKLVVTDSLQSAHISATSIGKVDVGEIHGTSDVGTTLASDTTIRAIKVRGDAFGAEDAWFSIRAGNAGNLPMDHRRGIIGSISVGGDMDYAQIVAGEPQEINGYTIYGTLKKLQVDGILEHRDIDARVLKSNLV